MGCSVAGCDRKHLARGYCRVHYEAMRRTGDPLKGLRSKPGPCSTEGCDGITVGQGLCRRCYGREAMRKLRAARKADLPERYCKFCGKAIPLTRPSRSVFCSKGCKATFELGLSKAEYDAFFEAQGGRCAICGRADPTGQRKRWCVDHDHKTGRKRGLLCISCNSGLGQFKDDPEILQAAIRYLSR